MTTRALIWAMSSRGLSPAAKLVLILAADDADMDGRAFTVDSLPDRANLTAEAFEDVVRELGAGGFALLNTAADPATGARSACLVLASGMEDPE